MSPGYAGSHWSRADFAHEPTVVAAAHAANGSPL